MVTLHQLQRRFYRALINADLAAVAPLIAEDGMSVEERLEIYRNNVFASLTRVLKSTFPVVGRLVHDRFFGYAAFAFIRAHPPLRACLAEYGADFPKFLGEFEPCRALCYLPDVARLEWLMNVAAHAAHAVPLPVSALVGIKRAEAPRLIIRLDETLGLLSSPWPIDAIWRANRSSVEGGHSIDLASGPVCLEVRRREDEVVFRTLDAGVYAFRLRLHQGLSLEVATDAALATDANFNLASAIQDLFFESLVLGLELARR